VSHLEGTTQKILATRPANKKRVMRKLEVVNKNVRSRWLTLILEMLKTKSCIGTIVKQIVGGSTEVVIANVEQRSA